MKTAGYQVAATYAGNDAAAAAFAAEHGIKTFKWSVADYDACVAGIAEVEAALGLSTCWSTMPASRAMHLSIE